MSLEAVSKTPVPPRSWAELTATLHGGLGVLDSECRLIFASDRFLPALGTPEELLGRNISQVMPALAENDPRQLKRHLANGERVDFEQQFTVPDGAERWYRVTVLPASVGANVAAVAFCIDVTGTRYRLNQLRDATAALTVVENERRSRLSRDVHDGLIQLLAALIFRLGMSETDSTTELQQAVSDVAGELRRVIEEFSPQADQKNGDLIEQWTAPLVVNTGLSVKTHDHSAAAHGYAEAQAAFVLVYQALRAVRDPSLERTLHMYLSDENGGVRIIVTIPSRGPAVLTGRRAVRLRTVTHHAQSLGGTLTHEMGDDNVRRFSMWIPRLTDQARAPGHTPAPATPPVEKRCNDLNALPALTESAWSHIVTNAPEHLIAFDSQMRISWVNNALSESIGLTLDEVVEATLPGALRYGGVPNLASIMHRLQAGEFVEELWTRTTPSGDTQRAHMSLSPRVDSSGQWTGLLAALDDRTDVELLDDLYQSVLADLTLARHRAIEKSIRRLEQPLSECQQLIERIDRFEGVGAEADAIATIKLALAEALQSLRSTNSSFAVSPHKIVDLRVAVRESLGTLLDGRQLLITDRTMPPPTEETVDVLFRIAREAVNNAVLHGDADAITITLTSVKDGTHCVIHDNGIGLAADHIEHAPGHLGTRVMRARARERGGTCVIERHPVIGTVVTLFLPHTPIDVSSTDRLAAERLHS